ncbi:aldehyde dehydrogenase family protein [Kurthia sibirica]|uniref:Aldehyde dehydrogenase n=1 Tax=Kurthia sibirica TaxID=202750 RepID=A0A2U3AQ43_9BACL|nr:aldehyde dehydrogenase family protein [Kurthia sibirica]PWI26647.1 aldehyde dehydrogenase [Kurthia sibirica]GEK32908.1 putative aldehyde dehydrogenase DhaS [Kurthia sibirica]
MTNFETIEQPKLQWAAQWLKDIKGSYINGEWLTTGPATISSINPANGSVVGAYYEATTNDVDTAIVSARQALTNSDWKTISKKQRAKIMHQIAGLIYEHQAELATLEALDNGKLYSEAYNDDVQECAELFEYYAGWTDKYYAENNPVNGDFLSVTTVDPIGVCAQIVPFNFPLQMACLKMAPALSMGNTLLLKPSNKTSFSAIRLFEIIAEANILPAGTINLILGKSKLGSHMSTHAGVDKLSFTGSTNVGKQLVRDSADSNLKPVTLELGGKSPNILFADYAKRDEAIEKSFYALFTHKAEKCSSPTRLFVEKSIYNEVVEKMAAFADAYKLGDPFDPSSDQGAQISTEHMESILGYIESGIEQGARVAAGGYRDIEGENVHGCFVRPTIMADVTNDMKIAQEEIFGPVLCVIPFETEEEVIAQANDTIYGLGAGLWTADMSRAHRVANQLEAGMVFVNKYGCYDFASPFGGVKQSGWGKEYAIHSLAAFTKKRAIWFAY